jgi:formylglycine-generating enzyme required for sulfatase activity
LTDINDLINFHLIRNKIYKSMKSKIIILILAAFFNGCNNIPKEINNSLNMKFIFIEPGTFIMGSDEGESNEKPAHEITISNGFYLQTTEVTVGQFKFFIQETNYITTAEKEDGTYVFTEEGYQKKEDANWRNPYFEQTDNHPIICISRKDMDAFIEWLSKKENKQYRLPTEAEWEYACRSGSSSSYFWGDSIDGKYCWYKENSNSTTHPVGKTLPNNYGLYDMLGNVMEACSDIYDEEYYKETPTIDPKGVTKGDEVVFKGGGWYFPSEYCRSSVRFGGERTVRSPIMGFRLIYPID